MHTITVDDESLAVRAMLRELRKKDPDGTHIGMVKAAEFLEYVRNHPELDIAFIDVEMKTDGITLTKKGTIEADPATYLTNLPDVYAIGDATNRGASIAIEAIGEGGRCAAVVDSALRGEMKPYRAPFYSKKTVTAADLADREKQPRCQMPVRPAAERAHDFAPVNLGFSDETAIAEAKRCLECGCHDYHDCKLIRYAQQQEIHPERFDGIRNTHETERKLICIERDNGKCILCGLCVRVCDEVAKQGILGLIGRGFPTVVKPEFNNPETIKVCATCKKCAEACPTGALKVL